MEEGSLFQRMKQIFHEDEMDEEMQKEAAALIAIFSAIWIKMRKTL